MRFNFLWKFLLLAACASAGSLRADPTAIKSEPKTVKLFVRVVPITVLGRAVKVTTIDQSDGAQGFSPEQSDGFHLELVNQLPVPTSYQDCL
jgi:hypothetical protein